MSRRRNPQRDVETVREEAFNVLLAEALKKHGIRARAERRSRGNAPDIRFELPTGELVLIECKWASAKSALNTQLADRVGDFPEAIGRLGVLYPEHLKHAEDESEALGKSEDLEWYVHSSRGKVAERPVIRRGGLTDFADHLRNLPLELESQDRVMAAATVVGHALDQSTKMLGRHARIARRVSEIIASTDKEKDRAAAQRIGCLVLFNALAFHDRLTAVNDQVATVNEVMTNGGGGGKPSPRRMAQDLFRYRLHTGIRGCGCHTRCNL